MEFLGCFCDESCKGEDLDVHFIRVFLDLDSLDIAWELVRFLIAHLYSI
jgi:hypothetical protein